MNNQVYTGTPTSRRQVILPVAMVNNPTLYPGGTPILVGGVAYVTLDSPQANVNGCTCLSNGSFSLTVNGTSADSPIVNAQVNPGDALYAANGTFDAATNVTYNLRIDKNSSGVRFGSLDPTQTAIPAGTINTAATVAI